MPFASFAKAAQANLWVCKQGKTLKPSQFLDTLYYGGSLVLSSGKKLAFFFIIIISESLDLNDDDKMPLEPFPGCRSQKRKNEKEMEISDLKEQYSNLNLWVEGPSSKILYIKISWQRKRQ